MSTIISPITTYLSVSFIRLMNFYFGLQINHTYRWDLTNEKKKLSDLLIKCKFKLNYLKIKNLKD